MIRIGTSGHLDKSLQPQEEKKAKEPLTAQEMRKTAGNLINFQHKALRKRIARMLSDGQKGLNNIGVHEEKAFRLIAHHKGQLQHALQSFDEKHVMPFVEKEVFKQEEMFASAKQTLESGGKPHEGLGAEPPHQGLGARPPEHKPHTHHSHENPHLGSHGPISEKEKLQEEINHIKQLIKALFQANNQKAQASLAQQLKEGMSSYFKTAKSLGDSKGRAQLNIANIGANLYKKDVLLAGNKIPAQARKPLLNLYTNLYKQTKAILNSSPTATFQDFLNKYGYNDYANGKKSVLLLCPQMLHIKDSYNWYNTFRFDTRMIFQISDKPEPPITTGLKTLMAKIEALEKLGNNPFATWVIKQIQCNPNVTESMSVSQIFNYLIQNNDIFKDCPGITDQQIQDVCNALGIPPISNLDLVKLYLLQLNFPKGSAGYNLQQALINECAKVSSLSALQQWVKSSILNGNSDIYLQYPGITQADMKSLFAAIQIPNQPIPSPTAMDQLFLKVYDAYQKTPSAKIFKDLYEEIQKLGSAKENISALQKWGNSMLNSADYKNSPVAAQAQFCIWTGNVTLTSLNFILKQWTNSSDKGQAALANYILSQKFTSLNQMRGFFNPNSPNYGFNKLDIYFQCPGLFSSSNPEGVVQNLFSMLFSGTSSKPGIPTPTNVDKAYAEALKALVGASPADKALFNLLINQCKQMGSDWSQFTYWVGYEMLSSTFANASSSAKSLFEKICGIQNPNTAPLIGMSYYLSQLLKSFDPDSQTYQFLSQITAKLNTMAKSNGTLGDFDFWMTGSLFKNKVDIYMLCPDASTQELQEIYRYMLGPNAKVPPPTQADKNYIAVYNAMNQPGVYSGNKALFQDLLNVMMALGSNDENQGKDIESYFNSHPTALAQLKQDWANADSAGQAFFEKYANGWNPENS